MASVHRVKLAYNNVYLVESAAGRVLIDTGPDYRGAWDELGAELAARPDVVLATHGHLDHAGLGARWQTAGVPVAMAADDAALPSCPPLSSTEELAQFEAYVRASGAPEEVMAALSEGLRQRHHYARALAANGGEYRPDRGGHWPTALRYEPFVPEIQLNGEGEHELHGVSAVSCPGHTPGNLVGACEEEGWLFSGDQLLPGMTPTPAIQSHAAGCRSADWRFRSLPAFVASLEKLAKMTFSGCYPGHGEPFDDVAAAIQANLDAIAERSERVFAELRAAGPSGVYQVAERMYPRALQRRFWQIVPTVQGNLDLLEEQGRVVLVDGRYEATV